MKRTLSQADRRGFSLVEIMIVVLIIGILASLALPALTRARHRSLATQLSNNFRVYAAAFQVYSTEHGEWPADTSPGKTPSEMEGQLPHFSEKTRQGGVWDWDNGVAGFTAGVSLHKNNIEPAVIQRIDEIMDDGNLGTGQFQNKGGFITYILEP
jgi:prepilin-type N-terminal cleavage/methylation domain-containing protein